MMNILTRKKICNINSNDVKREIAIKLNSVCSCLDSTYNINSGGCCYVAYCLSKLLKEDGFNVHLVIYDRYKNTYSNIDEVEESKPHYGILLGKYHINDRYFSKRNFYKTVINEFTSKDLLHHYNIGSWNDRYNKKRNKFIAKTLKTFYYDITENLREG